MKQFILSLFVIYIAVHQTVSADILPVFVTSEIKNDTWFPLPLDQMKEAAVDTALTRISETGNFAFLFDPMKAKQKHIGSLNLKVTLIEPAESAKITIRLTLPNQNGTYVSSSSVSLSNKNYKGIFDALESLGRDGAEQIFHAIEDLYAKYDISEEEKELRMHIIELNKEIIGLNYSINKLDLSAHNEKVEEKLALLNTLNDKFDKHHEYIKASDVQKNKKLDAIYLEIQKLNIGSNTDNILPSRGQLTEYDITQLPQLIKANELKYQKKFIEAREVLELVSTDRKISPIFRAVIKEELNINLPIYEAGITRNYLTKYFLDNDQYDNVDIKPKIKYINQLYDFVLAQPDLSFTKRIEISDKKSKINLMGEEIGTVISMLSMASKQHLSRALRSLMNKHITGLAMGYKVTGKGQCPSLEFVKKEMKIIKINAEIVLYKDLADDKCALTIKLRDSSKQKITFIFGERTTEYN